jgi:ribosomal protein S18 acetylase RimI-like enzyme
MSAPPATSPSPPVVDIVPATSDRFEDVAAVLAQGDARACLCQWFWLSSGDYARSTLEERRTRLRRQTEGTPPPGLLAYVDGVPAGWVGFGPRAGMERLVRSRTIPTIDDEPVWSVVCFTVRTGFRRRGLADALLRALVRYAREQGAGCLEAYPAVTEGRRIQTAAAYVGTLSMFLRAGFDVISETDARSDHMPRVLVRLRLDRDE